MDTIFLILEDAGATRALGAAMAKVLQPGDVLALSGELGAGKTTLTQGLAAGLGIPGDVLSPTFALMSEYKQGRIPLLHVDAYRLKSAEEADHLGLDEYLDQGWALVIEWPEHIAGALPKDHIAVHLRHEDDRRSAEIRATGPEARKRIEEFQIAGSGN